MKFWKVVPIIVITFILIACGSIKIGELKDLEITTTSDIYSEV